MTRPKLYYSPVSPAVRSTLLTIAALDLDVELIPVNLMAGEHLTPQFLKKNPLHTVPTLEDGNFVLFDSHAINAYLVGKYGKNDSLYPKDLQKRAIVDQRLHFDSGILFPRMGAIVGAILRQGAKVVEKDKADLVAQAYQSLETLLEGNTYVTGNELTIADFSLVATVSSTNSVLVPVASNTYPKITAWLARMQSLPYYNNANQVGVDMFKGMIQSKLA
ncbi:glutathione S-transferase 1-like [Sitophilus oryzae]|uniref:Glutathione S-transferase 1-like n=1 Tax=Sitophilus oryzae TaxID=7048 RepID=A0A4P2S815_SITOR|nr:glutathione S-transferase 1-like [Sitophilus oryzae]AVR54953.1 glutathione s-transferase epsilon class 7 [Sitophilus oryzae]